jgi:hypothetical protein
MDNLKLIGKDVSWKDMEWHSLEAVKFLPLSLIENGKVKKANNLLPYGTLRVIDHNQNDNELMLPILHRLDYQHLWELYKERGLASDEQVCVIY